MAGTTTAASTKQLPTSRQVGILTFHFNYNYGGVLQAHATSRVLRDAGYEPVFPSYLPPYFRQWVSPFRGWGVRSGGIFKAVPRRLQELPRRRAFDRFRRAHFPVLGRYDSPHRLADESSRFRGFVVGSDQVWNLRWMDEFNGYFFLEFLPDGAATRRISYAACFGQRDQRPDYLERVVPLLRRFDAIGVRVDLTGDILRRAAGVEATRVVDPTMLHDFEDIRDPGGFEQDCIVVYALDAGTLSIGETLAVELKRRTGLPIVFIRSEHEVATPWADRVLDRAGPETWVEHFRRASYIVTDSFHGCVFSLKFKRRFLAYSSGWRSARIEDLLGRYGVRDRLCLDKADASDVERIFVPIDHPKVHEAMAEDVAFSRRFLLDALA